MIDTIMANRDSFPSEEFTIRTDLSDGASITTTVPSIASMKGEIFKSQMAEKQAAYDLAAESEAMAPDPEVVKLNAMAKVVQSLIVDNDEIERTPADAAYLILVEQYQDEVGNVSIDTKI